MNKLAQLFGTSADIKYFGEGYNKPKTTPKTNMSFMQKRQNLYNSLQSKTSKTTIGPVKTKQTAQTKIQMMSPRTQKQTKVQTQKSSFGDAFANARKQGLKEFNYNGKKFTTQLKGEKDFKYVKGPETKQQQLVQNKPGTQPIQVFGENKSAPIVARGIDTPKTTKKFNVSTVNVQKPGTTPLNQLKGRLMAKKAEYVFEKLSMLPKTLMGAGILAGGMGLVAATTGKDPMTGKKVNKKTLMLES